MKRKRAKSVAIICLTLILIIQIAVFVYFGNAKQGYHHDEILSFQISNYFENRSSYNISSKSDYYNNWHDAEYFKSALPAREGDLFNFLEVCDNVRKDNHPVLFYGVFHAVCSLFPEVFSKWLGIIPNILYFVVMQIALYAIGCRIGKSRIFALLMVAAYGFSAAAISSVMLIRMYAMLAMWAVMQTYCHLRIYENCNEKKWYVFAGILTFCGVNTQYYYIVFQFFVSAVCFIYLFIKYRWKKAMTYAASIFAGLGATVIAWPFIIRQVLFGSRGKEAIKNLTNENNILSTLIANVEETLVNGWGIQVLLILAVLWLIAFVCKKKIRTGEASGKMLLITMMVAILGYLLIISKIAPYSSVRYAMVVLPLMVICVLWGFWSVLLKLLRKPGVVALGLALAIAVVTGCSYTEKRVEFLYENWPDEVKALEPYVELDAVVLADNSWKTAGVMVQHFSEHPRTYFAKTKDITKLAEATAECGDSFFLYLEKNDQAEENLKQIEAAANVVAEEAYNKNSSFGMYWCNRIAPNGIVAE